MTASWESARALRTFSDSILARFLFCSFRGEDVGPRLAAYLEEVVHPLLTGEEVAIELRAAFVQFWGSAPFRWGLVPRARAPVLVCMLVFERKETSWK